MNWLGLIIVGIVAVQTAAETAKIKGFEKFKAPQDDREGCWAACLQMLLNCNGVTWSQKDILRSMKGKIDWESATAPEITEYLRGFNSSGFRSTEVGAPVSFGPGKKNWTVGAYSVFSGDLAADSSAIVQGVDIQRPTIVSLKTQDGGEHAVFIYEVDYYWKALPPAGGIPRGHFVITRLKFYDPLPDEEVVIEDMPKFFKRISAMWTAFVQMNRTF
jgi:hypothetical protein